MARRFSVPRSTMWWREKWRCGDAVRRNSNERETEQNANKREEKFRLRCKFETASVDASLRVDVGEITQSLSSFSLSV